MKKTTLMNSTINITNKRWGIQFTATVLPPTVRKHTFGRQCWIYNCVRDRRDVKWASKVSRLEWKGEAAVAINQIIVLRNEDVPRRNTAITLSCTMNPLNKFYLLRAKRLPPLLPKNSHVKVRFCHLFDTDRCFENWRISNILGMAETNQNARIFLKKLRAY
jgi:hypothetical protein